MKIGIAGLPGQTGNYEAALRRAALNWETPVQIEVSLSSETALGWDALLLPGGGDISPAFLPGCPPLDPACAPPDPALDEKQLRLLESFVLSQKPVLGICKGMQLIGLFFGAGFCQHLLQAPNHRCLEYDRLHPTQTAPGSFLRRLYGEFPVVNSAHHQGLLFPDQPAGAPDACRALRTKIAVIQKSDDGVVEGIAHETLPIFGLQWHPERLCGRFLRPDAVDGSLVFSFFLRQIRESCR